MNNDITIFESEQFGKIRIIDGELFVASDVCAALDIQNTADALRRLDDDEKGIDSIDTLGGRQTVAVVTEYGLYALVLGSRKPEAREFKRWITHEVIPSIRKYGAYMTPVTIEAAIANPDFMIGLLENLKIEQAKRIAAEETARIMAPKAEFYDAVAGSKTAIDIGNAAKVLEIPGVGRNKLFEILRDQGILDGSNIPYQTYIDRGYFRVIEQKYTTPTGETRINFKSLVYQRGLDYIRKAVAKK